jgi:hypothetical protein
MSLNPLCGVSKPEGLEVQPLSSTHPMKLPPWRVLCKMVPDPDLVLTKQAQ